ncbi:hypothetical protein [Enterococcus faecalis]|uniref:hypothetical protein n=1 Tax=Enterococcus faecalis TaxID=1351 RepID=UPI0019F6BAE3|nr:hypothetical protein [Enterococcus faecalis]
MNIGPEGLDNDIVMDYPKYKKKYPDKNMDDWLEYSTKATYEESIKMLKKYKDELTPEEYKAVEKELEEYRKEYLDNA